jgi:hypothetical protein
MADSQPPSQQNGSEQPPPSEDNIKTEPDLDTSIEQDVEMNPDQPDEGPALDPMAPAPTPSKKETSLREFLGKMDDYAPIVSSSAGPGSSSSSNPHLNSDQELTNLFRSQMPSQHTTSLSPVSHHQAQGPAKRRLTSRVS